MADSYYSGSAASFADVKSAIEAALVLEGWTLNSGVLSKGTGFFKLTAATDYLDLAAGTGQAGSALTDAAPGTVRIARFTTDTFSFPVNYELFINAGPDEVFCIVNHAIDRYQNLSFGVSPAPGNSYGVWINGTCGASSDIATGSFFFTSSPGLAPMIRAGGVNGRVSLGIFAAISDINSGYGPGYMCYFIRDNEGWGPTAVSPQPGSYGGDAHIARPLIYLPSSYNQALVLLPIYGVKAVSDNGSIITASLGGARACRIDNHAPGQIVPYGGDSWKVFPWYRKDLAARYGGTLHSGTLGYAFRYHGP